MPTLPPPLVLDEATSTNHCLAELLEKGSSLLPNLSSVLALNQTAGRGQRGNVWLSEDRANLTFSFLLLSGSILASEQYCISQLVAVALLDTLKGYLPFEEHIHLKIKWPNDIYYQDKKLAGILIEHTLLGRSIQHSIIGIGLNINQTNFPPSLPNPISLRNITGHSYDVLELHSKLMVQVAEFLPLLQPEHRTALHALYMQSLYRLGEWYRYKDRGGDSFTARIVEVLPIGHLVLEREDGTRHAYAFKEVAYLC